MMIVIDEAAGMTKYMWEYLDTVVIGKEMDIVDRLRQRIGLVKFDSDAIALHDAANEIEQLREVLKELEWQLKNQLYDAAYETVIHTLWPQLKEKE
jgi:hypothetical protein